MLEVEELEFSSPFPLLLNATSRKNSSISSIWLKTSATNDPLWFVVVIYPEVEMIIFLLSENRYDISCGVILEFYTVLQKRDELLKNFLSST